MALFGDRERELIKRHYTRSWLIKIHKMFVRLSDKTGQGKGMVRAWLPNNTQIFIDRVWLKHQLAKILQVIIPSLFFDVSFNLTISLQHRNKHHL